MVIMTLFIASARSNGGLFVSATEHIKNIINTGNNGIIYHIDLWLSIFSVKFKLPDIIITTNNADVNTNS